MLYLPAGVTEKNWCNWGMSKGDVGIRVAAVTYRCRWCSIPLILAQATCLVHSSVQCWLPDLVLMLHTIRLVRFNMHSAFPYH